MAGRGRKQGVGWLLAAAAAMAVTWLFVLPRVGSLGPVREFVRGNEAAGINPSAMYYTEIDAMGAIGERVRMNRLPRDAVTPIR